MNQAKKKAVRIIVNATIQHVSDSIRDFDKGEDFFVLETEIVVDPLGALIPGKRVTTSRLIRIDIEKAEFETENSIYRLIRAGDIWAYRMTDPAPKWDPTDPKAQWPHPLAPKGSTP